MFAQASRLKLRFRVSNGLVGVEDLWDLNLTQLDKLAVELRREANQTEESFLETTKKDPTLELRFNIVKSILETKLNETNAAKEEKARRQKKQQLLEILERKQNEQLDSLSVEDIQKQIDAL